MFGLGYLEIGLLLLLIIVLFGGKRVGRFIGNSFRVYRKVDNTRQDIKRQFSLAHLLGLNKDKS